MNLLNRHIELCDGHYQYRHISLKGFEWWCFITVLNCILLFPSNCSTLPLDYQYQYRQHYTTGEQETNPESTEWSGLVTQSSSTGNNYFRQYSSSSSSSSSGGHRRVYYPRSSSSGIASLKDRDTTQIHRSNGLRSPINLDSDIKQQNWDPSQLQRGERPNIPRDLIEELYPDVIVHDSEHDNDPPPPINLDSHYPGLSSSPVASVVTDVYQGNKNNITPNINIDNNIKRDDSIKRSDSEREDTAETNNNPPTIFHQDYYLDIEELLKQLESNTEEPTYDFDHETDSILDDDNEDENIVNNDEDTTTVTDYNNSVQDDAISNPELLPTASKQDVTTVTQSAIDNGGLGNVNNNTNHNTRDYAQDETLRTTTNNYQSLDAAPFDDILPPNQNLSITITNTGLQSNSDINTGNNNVASTYPTVKITQAINSDNQDTILSSNTNTTQRSVSVQTAILGITQQPQENSNSTLDYIFSSLPTTTTAIENSEQQTADPQSSRDFNISLYQGATEENTFTQTTFTFSASGVYIPQDLSNSNDSNTSFIGDVVTTSIKENKDNNFISSGTSFITNTERSPSFIDVINDNATRNENSDSLNSDGSSNSNNTSAVTTLLDIPSHGGNSEVGLDNNQYVTEDEVTTQSQFNDGGSGIIGDGDYSNNNNNNNDLGINTNNKNNKDLVTTSDYIGINPANEQEGLDSKSNNKNSDNTDKDHTDSRDTGIILGSTLTIAGVIVLGIMITLCCACLKKKKEGKDGVAGDSYTYAGANNDKHNGNNDDDNSSEESYGFGSSSKSRRRTSQHQKVPQTDTYAINPGVEVPVEETCQVPQKSSSMGLGGFSFASLTWKRKDKKKKEKYNSNNGANNGDDNITVQERIKAFEGKMSPASQAKFAAEEDAKPRKKKPKNKAFEEFESTGLIIGFGNPRKPKISETEEDTPYTSEFPGFPEIDLEQQPHSLQENHAHYHSREYHGSNEDHINDEEGLGSMGSMEYRMPCLSKSQESDRSISLSSGSKLTEDEGIHTMDSEDDELGNAVPRQTEILKSFRRAPPPRNRARGRRSLNRRGPHREDTSLCSLELPEEDENECDDNDPTLATKNSNHSSKPTEQQGVASNLSEKPLFKIEDRRTVNSGINGKGFSVNNTQIKSQLNDRMFGAIHSRTSKLTSACNSSKEQDNPSKLCQSNSTGSLIKDRAYKSSRHDNSAPTANVSNTNISNHDKGERKSDTSNYNTSGDWRNRHPLEASPLWRSKSMTKASANHQSDNTVNQFKSKESPLLLKGPDKKDKSKLEWRSQSQRDSTPGWIGKNYNLVKEQKKDDGSTPIVLKQQFKLDTEQYKIGAGNRTPSPAYKPRSASYNYSGGNTNQAKKQQSSLDQPKYKTDSSRTGSIGTTTNTPPLSKLLLDNVKPQSSEQQGLRAGDYRAKNNTQPPVLTHYSQLGMAMDNNNNGNSRSSTSRPNSHFMEDNNNLGYNSNKTYSSSSPSINNTVATYSGKSSTTQGQQKNVYSSYEAEATFTDQGGNYSFYTPNPLEEDSDDENTKHQEVFNSQAVNKGHYRRSGSHDSNINSSSLCDAEMDKTDNKCDSKSLQHDTDNIIKDRNKSLSNNLQTEQLHLSFGTNNQSDGNNIGTPLSGLTPKSEVTHRPNSVTKVPFTIKKPFNSVRPCYENLLPQHKVSSQQMHLTTPYNVATSPSNNELQQEVQSSYYSQQSGQSTRSATTPPPELPPRGLTYLRRGVSSGVVTNTLTSGGYGIARPHDPQSYNDTSVISQFSQPVQEKQTYETEEPDHYHQNNNSNNDDVFYTDMTRHDSGYYTSTPSSHITSYSNNMNTSLHRYSSNMSRHSSNYSPNYPNVNSALPSPMDTTSSAHSSCVQSPMDTTSSYTTSVSNVQSPVSPISPTDDGNSGGNNKTFSQIKSNFLDNTPLKYSFSQQKPRRSHSQNDYFFSNKRQTNRQLSDENAYKSERDKKLSNDSKSEGATSLDRTHSSLKFNADFEGTCV